MKPVYKRSRSPRCVEKFTYQSLALLQGQFFPSCSETPAQGALLVANVLFPATLMGRVSWRFAKHKLKPDQELLWLAYPKVRQGQLTFDLAACFSDLENFTFDCEPGHFRVRGQLTRFDATSVRLIVFRTTHPPQHPPTYFKLDLLLPSYFQGHRFWRDNLYEFEGKLIGEQLMVQKFTQLACQIKLPRPVPELKLKPKTKPQPPVLKQPKR